MVETNFDFESYNFNDLKKEEHPELIKNLSQSNPSITKQDVINRKYNYQEFPDYTESILNGGNSSRTNQSQSFSIPMDNSSSNSYLNLVLSPNLRDVELLIRGLEYIKVYNPMTGQDEIQLARIDGHPLNEFGVNMIMKELRIYTSPEIKLARRRVKDCAHSVQQISRSIVRLIYKNLKNFGMDTQVKQRNAKSFCLAIIEMIDSSYSRSIEGKENDLSRATEFKIEGSVDTLNDPSRLFSNKKLKEGLKN